MCSDIGTLTISMADVHADNIQVNIVFITVPDIKVYQRSVNGFEGPTTMDVLVLQNGRTELLLKDRFKAGSYNSFALELDFEADGDGNSPGIHIKKIDKTKQKPSGKATAEYAFNGTKRVMENSKSSVIRDSDSGKFIMPESEVYSGYSLAIDTEMNGYLRFADENFSGSLKGTFNGQIDAKEEVAVYVYKKGQFNSGSELKEPGGIPFKNAVASAMVDKGPAANTYRIRLLDEGQYEVHFVSYEEGTTGNLCMRGELEVDTHPEVNLTGIEIKPGIEATINVIAKDI